MNFEKRTGTPLRTCLLLCLLSPTHWCTALLWMQSYGFLWEQRFHPLMRKWTLQPTWERKGLIHQSPGPGDLAVCCGNWRGKASACCSSQPCWEDTRRSTQLSHCLVHVVTDYSHLWESQGWLLRGENELGNEESVVVHSEWGTEGRGEDVNLYLMSVLYAGHHTHPVLSNFHNSPMGRHYHNLTDEETGAEMFNRFPKRFSNAVHGSLGNPQDSSNRTARSSLLSQ